MNCFVMHRRIALSVIAGWLLCGLSGAVSVADEADAPDVAALAEQLRDGDVAKRRDAAYALADLGHRALPALPALIEALGDRDEQVWHQSTMAVARIGPDARDALPALTEHLRDRSDQVRYRSAWAVSRLGSGVIPQITEVLRDTDDSRIRFGLISAVSQMDDAAGSVTDDLYAELERAYSGGNAEVGAAVVRLTALVRPGNHDLLLQALTSDSDIIAAAAVESVADLSSPDERLKAAVRGLTSTESGAIRASAVSAFGRMEPNPEAVSEVISAALENTGPGVADAVVATLRRRPDVAARVTPVLKQSLLSEDSAQRGNAAFVISLLGDAAADAVPALVDSLVTTPDGETEPLAAAIGRVGRSAVPVLLQAAVEHPEAGERIALTLARVGPAATSSLSQALREGSPEIRVVAAAALAGLNPVPESAVEPLTECLRHPSPEVRAAGADTLAAARTGDAAAVAALKELSSDPEPTVRGAALRALAASGAPADDLIPLLLDGLASEHAVIRSRSISGLSLRREALETRVNEVLPRLAEALRDSSPEVRVSAAECLEGMGAAAEPIVPALVSALDDQDVSVKRAVLNAVAATETGDPKAAAAVRKCLGERDALVVLGALRAVRMMEVPPGDSADAVLPLLTHEESEVRSAATTCVRKAVADTPTAVEALKSSLSDPDWAVRQTAARELGAIGQEARSAVTLLYPLLASEEDSDFARSAIRSIDDADESAIPVLIEGLNSGDDRRVYYASFLLGKIGPSAAEALPALRKLESETDSRRFREVLRRSIDRLEGKASDDGN